jgi:hypothetical protein
VRTGRRAAQTRPRAVAARYDRATGRLVVELASGATFTVPASPVEGLADAAPEALERIRVTPGGEGLHFPALDAGFGVPGLLAGVFGSKAWMREIDCRAAG